MKKLLSIFLPVLIVLNINAQNITIKINGGENLSGTSLQNAIDTNALSSIEHLEVNAGYFSTADWTYLKLHHNEFTSMTHFTVTETVDSVADIPNTTYSEPYFKRDKIEHISIAKLLRVGVSAFSYCTVLNTINLPHATELDDNALEGCYLLTETTLPKVMSIGEQVFKNCRALKTMEFPNLSNIKKYAFRNCKRLRELKLGVTPPVIQNHIFIGLPSFRCLLFVDENGNNIPDTTYQTAIENYTSTYASNSDYSKWQGFTFSQYGTIDISVNEGTEVYSGNNLQGALENWSGELSDIIHLKVNGGQFNIIDWLYLYLHHEGFTSMTHFTVTETVDSVVDIPSIYSQVESYFKKNKIQHISIAKLKKTGARSFFLCEALKSVYLPDLKYVGSLSFSYCQSLKSITLPKVTDLETKAFMSCASLRTVTLPQLSQASSHAFSGCYSLYELKLGITPPYVSILPLSQWGAPQRFLSFVDENGNYLLDASYQTAFNNYKLTDDGDTTDNKWLGWSLLQPGTVSVSVNDDPEVYSGTHLHTALQNWGGDLSDITSLEINGGWIGLFDWAYLKQHRNNFSSMTRFTVTEAVDSVADLPDVLYEALGNNYDSSCFKKSKIKYISIAKLKKIGNRAFYSCDSLETVNFPDALSLGEYSFYDCDALSSVNFPELDSIGKEAFSLCDALTHISFPNVTHVGEQAFYVCKSLTSASFPKVTNIAPKSFQSCFSLTEINFPQATQVQTFAFKDCRALLSLSLPKATTIDDYAFQLCKSLKSLNLPLVTTIHYSAFSSCSALQTVHLPLLTNIGHKAFYVCRSLNSACLPQVTTVGAAAFQYCTSLLSVSLPKVTNLGYKAFANNSSLYFMKLGSTPPTVGEHCFAEARSSRYLMCIDDDCNLLPDPAYETALDNYQSVNDGDTTDNAWYGWSLSPPYLQMSVNGDTSVYTGTNLQGALENWGGNLSEINTIEINGGNVNNTDWEYLKEHHNEFTAMTDFTITNDIDVVLNIPDISSSDADNGLAYFKRDKIKNINLAKLKIVGSYGFYKCNNLTSVTLPEVRDIRDSAFYNCNLLDSIKLGINSPDVTDSSVFEGCANFRYLSFVKEDTQVPTLLECHEGFYDYSTVDDGNTQDNKWYGWTLPDVSPLTISINGDTSVYSGDNLAGALSDWGGNFSDITHLEINGGSFITADWIYLRNHYNEFAQMTHFSITNAIEGVANMPDISSYQMNILHYAYFKRDVIQNVSIAKIKRIGNGAFFNCNALVTADFPDVVSVGEYAFYFCNHLSNMNIPLLTYVEKNGFRGCGSLSSQTFPRITGIATEAFKGCGALYELKLGVNPPVVAGSAFHFLSPLRFLSFVDENGNALTDAAYQEALANYKQVDDGDTTDNKWYGWHLTSSGTCTIALNEDTTSYTGNGLGDALSVWGGNLSNITHLKIKGGVVREVDWMYLKNHTEDLSEITHFTVTNEVDTVENMPNLSDGQSYFKSDKIKNISVAKLQKIGNKAFKLCTALDTVFFPQVTQIGNAAFQNCTNLRVASFPRLTHIGSYTFHRNYLLSILRLGATPPTISSNSFYLTSDPRYIEFIDEEGELLSALEKQTALANYKSVSDGDTTDNRWYVWRFLELQNIVIALNGDTTSYSGNGLFGALSEWGGDYSDITHLTVKGGTLTDLDWAYLRSYRNAFTAMTDFTVTESVDSVYNIPYSGQPYFKQDKIQNVSIAKVQEIGINAFYACDSLTTVNLPNAKIIGNQAFKNCSSLTTVETPNIITIGQESFKNCFSLTTVNAPLVNSIGNNAFQNDSSLTDINFTEVVSIEHEAFRDCSSLTLVDFPEATNISYNVFMDCNALVSVVLPKVTNISSGTFFNCTSLTTVNAPLANSIGYSAFEGCSSLNSVNLPEATTLGDQAFKNCNSLTTVNAPLVNSIGYYAFEDCSSLNSVNFPEVTSLGAQAFKNCSALISLDLPKVTEIAYEAFMNCNALTSLSLPKVTEISSWVFDGCSSFSELTLGVTPPNIGYQAFLNCPGTRYLKFVNENGDELFGAELNNAILTYKAVDDGNTNDHKWNGWILPEFSPLSISLNNDTTLYTGYNLQNALQNWGGNLSEISHLEINGGTILTSDWAYLKGYHNDFSSMTHFTVTNALDSVSEIPNINENEAYFKQDKIRSISIAKVQSIGEKWFREYDSLKVVSFPDAIDVGIQAFFDCDVLDSVNLPNVTVVRERAFKSCDSLKSINLSSVTHIKSDAFMECVSLDTVYFPLLTNLGSFVFANCSSLTFVNLPEVLNIGNSVFKGCSSLTTAYLPQVTNLGYRVFQSCVALNSISCPEATFVGERLFQGCESLITVSFPNVTSVGERPFEGCSSLEAVDLQELSQVGDYLFLGCTALNNVNLPKATYIGKEAFGGCTSLTSIDLPEVVEVKENAFYYCASLNSIDLPQTTQIDEGAFQYCVSLESVDFQELTDLGEFAFRNCTTLVDVNFPMLTNLKERVLEGCNSLTTLHFPEVTNIEDRACFGCYSLISLDLPKVINIGNQAFQVCVSLATLNLPEVTSIGDESFSNCIALSSASMPKLTNIGKYAFFNDTSFVEFSLGINPPTVDVDVSIGQSTEPFYNLPFSRYLTFVDEDGNALSPADYQTAINNYNTVPEDWDMENYKWYGWFILPTPTVNALVNYEYGDETIPLTAMASESCTLHWYMQEAGGEELSSVPTPSTDMAGTYSYWVSQTNDTTNLESGRVEIRVIVDKKEITVTPDEEQFKEQGEEDPVLTYTLTPELIGNDTLTGALSREPGEEVGIYTINQGTLNGGNNYEIIFVEGIWFGITTASDIDKIMRESSLVLYPNPTKNTVHILSDDRSVKSIEVCDINGKKVLESNRNTFNVENLSQGTYLVKIEMENGQLEYRKLIKN